MPEAGLEGIGEYAGLFTVLDSENWYQLDIGSVAVRMSHANPAAIVASESRVDGQRLRPVATSAETGTAAEM